MLITVRRHMKGIALNPYEYLMEESGDNVLNFKNRKQALQYLYSQGLEIKGEDEKLKEEILWNTYGIELHEIDRAQFAQLEQEIKSNNDERSKNKSEDGNDS